MFEVFRFDLASAVVEQLVEKLDSLEPSQLSEKNLEALKEKQAVFELPQGVYVLYDAGGDAVYAGKADNVFSRLRKHRYKLSGRKNIDPTEIAFKALLFEPSWSTAANESLLVKHFKDQGQCGWNLSGFGINDPGKRRDGAAPNQFDTAHPINEGWPCEFVEGATEAGYILRELKKNLPYVLRFKLAAGDGATAVDLDGCEMSAEGILTRTAASLGPYQLMRFAGYFTLYKRSPPHDYEFGCQLWPTD